MGFELVASGNTARVLREAGVRVREVSELTGFPEILSGRVKTLHPRVHAGILAREDQLGELQAMDLPVFDLVVVNLYPFEDAVAKDLPEAEVLEQIDIGGPTLVRAAAKNYPRVLVVVDPDDYDEVVARYRDGRVDLDFRRRFAWKAFAHTAAYDAAIAEWLNANGPFPERKIVVLDRIRPLRYGENPHQAAALYRVRGESGGLIEAEVLQGKAMSYNNYADAEAAWRLVREFDQPAAVALKHQMPCGVGVGADLAEAYARAYAADPVSIFGGIVAFNRPVDARVAEAIGGLFLEVIVAPGYSEAARARLAKKKNLRLIQVPEAQRLPLHFQRLTGGMLLQTPDEGIWDEVRVVTKRSPSPEETEALRLAMAVVKHARSNAIVVAKAGQTLGIGQGQTSRIEAARIALNQAGEGARGAVLASDAFFPFDDVVRLAGQFGISAIVQPGGSKRDADSIAAADELGIAMIFTGVRHFKH